MSLKYLGLAAAAAFSLTSVAAVAQVQGIATADLERAQLATKAFQAASAQIRTSYAAQITAAESRSKVLQAELQAMGIALQEAGKKPGATQKSLEPQVTAFQQKQAAAQKEIDTLSESFNLAAAYVREQISLREDEAVRNAMKKAKVEAIFSPQAFIAAGPSIDMTQKITDEYNLLVPAVQAIPPAGYRPGQLIQQAAQARQAAPTPAAQPQSR